MPFYQEFGVDGEKDEDEDEGAELLTSGHLFGNKTCSLYKLFVQISDLGGHGYLSVVEQWRCRVEQEEGKKVAD